MTFCEGWWHLARDLLAPQISLEHNRVEGMQVMRRDSQCLSAKSELSSGEVFNLNENGLVNGFQALIKFSHHLINLHPITMNENGSKIIFIEHFAGLASVIHVDSAPRQFPGASLEGGVAPCPGPPCTPHRT